MNTTTPLVKGGFVLLLHPDQPKVLLLTPELYHHTVSKDASFRDNRMWFRAARSLFPQGRTVFGPYKMGGHTRSPEYVKSLRKRG